MPCPLIPWARFDRRFGQWQTLLPIPLLHQLDGIAKLIGPSEAWGEKDDGDQQQAEMNQEARNPEEYSVLGRIDLKSFTIPG